ncbi:MAG: MFS transporter [Myxococcales bacterium]|nr:MFS transporter [Myxococcales bacterium]
MAFRGSRVRSPSPPPGGRKAARSTRPRDRTQCLVPFSFLRHAPPRVALVRQNPPPTPGRAAPKAADRVRLGLCRRPVCVLEVPFMTVTAAATSPPAPTDRRMRAWRWKVSLATWLCYVGYYFPRKPFSIVKGDLGTALHFDSEMLAWIWTTYLIAYTIGQFVSGAVGPRFGPRLMLLVGMGVCAVTAVATSFANQFAWFVTLMAVLGLFQATGWSNAVGTMAAWFHRGERGTVMGVWSTCFQVGNVAAAVLASWVLGWAGFRAPFTAGALAMMVVWVVVYFYQRNRPEDVGLPPVRDPAAARPASDPATSVDPTASRAEPSDGPVRWDTSTWITVLLVGVAYFGMKFIRYALDSWAPYFLKLNFGLSGEKAGYVSTLFGIAGIVGVVASGWVSDRWFGGRRALLSFVMILATLAATLAMFTVGTTGVVAFSATIALVGFALHGPDALLTGAGAMDIGKGLGAVRAAGIISGIGSAGSVVQEIFIGKLYKSSGGDIAPVLVSLFGAALLATVCIGTIVWRNRRGLSDV